MAITLYDLAGADENRRFSPYCWRARMALAHKGLTFTTVPWRYADKAVIAAFGSDRVPVIVDRGHAVKKIRRRSRTILRTPIPTGHRSSSATAGAARRVSSTAGPILLSMALLYALSRSIF